MESVPIELDAGSIVEAEFEHAATGNSFMLDDADAIATAKGQGRHSNAPGETAPALGLNASGRSTVPRRAWNFARVPGLPRRGQAVGGVYCHGDIA